MSRYDPATLHHQPDPYLVVPRAARIKDDVIPSADNELVARIDTKIPACGMKRFGQVLVGGWMVGVALLIAAVSL